MAKLSNFRRMCGTALIAFGVGFISPASAEPPMWVIEDTDSTIYLFGTVHLLKPDQAWLTDSVRSALSGADEVWFEIPLQGDLAAMQAQFAPIFMRAAFSPDKPLSSRLNAREKELLAAAIAGTEHPQQLSMAVERMKPWFAVVQLAQGPLLASGYDSENGMDMVLSRLAHENGTPVRALETFEQQIGFIARGTDTEQLDALRTRLNMSDATVRLETLVGETAIQRWVDGDSELLSLLMAVWRERPYPQRTPISYEVMIRDRNANWAQQIADRLAGDGVTFIAVGAGHLVGPDSVRRILAARGIEARPFGSKEGSSR